MGTDAINLALPENGSHHGMSVAHGTGDCPLLNDFGSKRGHDFIRRESCQFSRDKQWALGVMDLVVRSVVGVPISFGMFDANAAITPCPMGSVPDASVGDPK